MPVQTSTPRDVEAQCREAREGAVLFDRSDRGKVEVTGPEAARFLHNLCTNDVVGLAAGAGCEAFFATAKAKVVAYVLLYNLPGADGRPDFWIDTAPGLAPKMVAYLDHFLVSERVEFADRTTGWAQYHVAGPRAEEILGRVLAGPVRLEPLHGLRTVGPAGECQVRRWDGLGVSGYEVLCPAPAGSMLYQALQDAGAHPAGTEAFERLRVEAGTPAQGPDIDENTFAPEAGRTARAICYTKGCYLGQEPIVMARDRGHLNRTLLRVTLPGGPVPRGSLLFQDGKEVGRVTSSVSVGAGAVGLAYVRRGHQDPGTTLEVEVGGRRGPAIIAPAAG
jgi:folate-binding protein YgfZ